MGLCPIRAMMTSWVGVVVWVRFSLGLRLGLGLGLGDEDDGGES